MEEGYVSGIILKPGLYEITFFHPKHNSLPGHLLAELATTITEAGNNPQVEIIILKSAGDRTFCAGASFEELMNIETFEEGKHFFSGFARVINACRQCPKLIIGRVHGKAVGGGVGIAAAVDYCLASQYASIKLSELNVGIGPFVVGPAIERKMGIAAFSTLAIDASAFHTAGWAREFGLFADVLETTEALDEAVMSLANSLLGTNPEARQALKKMFWEGTEHWGTLLEERAAISGKLVLSTFTKEALKKFK